MQPHSNLANVVELDAHLELPEPDDRRHHQDVLDDVRLVTIADAADRLDLSRSKLYELIADGELPTIRIGRARRISLADLRDFVARHRAR